MMLNSSVNCPEYDVELIWHQQGGDIVSVGAAVDFQLLICTRPTVHPAMRLWAGGLYYKE